MCPALATRQRAGWSGFRMPVVASDFSRHQNFQTRCGTHLDSYSVATGVLFPRKSGLGVNETTPPSNAEIKYEWSCTSASPVCLQAWTGQTLPFYLFAGYCYLSLRLVTRDEHMQSARFEGLTACLRKSCASIYKPTRNSTCRWKSFLSSPEHRDQLRDPFSLQLRGCHVFLPCG